MQAAVQPGPRAGHIGPGLTGYQFNNRVPAFFADRAPTPGIAHRAPTPGIAHREPSPRIAHRAPGRRFIYIAVYQEHIYLQLALS